MQERCETGRIRQLQVLNASDTSNVPDAVSEPFAGGNGTPLPSLIYKCVAGSRSYKADVDWAGTRGGLGEGGIIGAKQALPCNAAGAWRVWAHEDSLGKPANVVLRRQLGPPPAPSGFEAHHIIPAYERNNPAANRLEAEGYACHLFPNASYNGINIEASLHRNLHNTRYWAWAANVLSRAIGSNMSCPSHSAARYWLGKIKHQIATGVFPGAKE